MKRLWQQRSGKQDVTALPPWFAGASIYGFLQRQIDPRTGQLTDSTIALPDADRQQGPDLPMRGTSRAKGGVPGHLSSSHIQELARKCADLVTAIAASDEEPAKLKLYDIVRQDSLLDYLDLAIDEISRSAPPAYPHLRPFVITLAENAPDRGAVKFALAMLGAIGNPADKALITLLGRHEEFTLYAATALTSLLDTPEPALWELAQSVEGWGRIHIVERLATTTSPAIQRWLLREGYRNRVMVSYGAYICATAGNLKEALNAESIDGDLLNAAGDILEALIEGGPTEDIDDYEDAATVLPRYLDHLQRQASSLHHLVTAYVLAEFLSDPDWQEAQRWRHGWTEDARQAALRTAQGIIAAPRWPKMVSAGLHAQDEPTFQTASRAAKALGIHTWPLHWARLKQRSDDPERWSAAVESATEAELSQVVSYAMASLPLNRIASGAASEAGTGSEWRYQQSLQAIVQSLGAYPHMGWPLLEAALKSPEVRLRNHAISTLTAWGREQWTPEILTALTAARDAEPSRHLRQRIEASLRADSLES